MKVFKNAINRAGRFANQIKHAKNTPKALMIGGISLIVVSGVYACVKTASIGDKLDDMKEEIDHIKDLKEDGEYCVNSETGETAEYTPALYRKDITHAWVRGLWCMSKPYIPAVGGVIAGIWMITKGQAIVTEELVEKTLALTCMTEAFQGYRRNVVLDQGEEADKRYMVGLETKKNLEMNYIDPETGEVKTKNEKKIDLINDVKRIASPYAVILSDAEWFKKDANYNSIYINSILRILQAQYDRDNFLYLYDVYKAYGMLDKLSIAAIAMSHQVGWIKGYADDAISINPICTHLGMEDLFTERFIADFNCMGGDYIDGEFKSFNDMVTERRWLDKSIN